MSDDKTSNLGGAPIEQVLANESEQIKERRRQQAASCEPGEAAPLDENIESDLVGLALSGGGIRSATFALGVLEGLKEFDLLKRVDYLSTVSGGGYIGSWLSANCWRASDPDRHESDLRPEPAGYCAKAIGWTRDIFVGASAKKIREPKERTDQAADKSGIDWLRWDVPWSGSIAHLRRYSNYLSPDFGFFSADTWTMVTVWLRNTLLIQAMVILAIAALLIAPRLVYSLVFKHWPELDQGRWLAVALFTLAIVGIAGSQRSLIEGERIWQRKENWLKGILLGAALFGLALWAIFHYDFDPFAKESESVGLTLFIASLLVFTGICLTPVAVAITNYVAQRLRSPRSFERVDYTQTSAQLLVIAPILITAILVASILWAKTNAPLLPMHNGVVPMYSHLHDFASYSVFFLEAWRYWPLPLCVAFVSLWILSISSIRAWTCRWLAVAMLAPIPAVVALHALLSVIMLVLHDWADTTILDGRWRAFVWAPGLLLIAFSLTIVVLIGMLGRASVEAVREWWSRLAAWILIYGVAWTAISAIAIYGPLWLEETALNNYASGISFGWILTTLGGLLAGNSSTTNDASKAGSQQKSMRKKMLEIFTVAAPFVFIAGLLFAISMLVHLLLTKLFTAFEPAPAAIFARAIFDLHDQHWTLLSGVNLGQLTEVFGALLVCLCLFSFRVDINEFGLNAFYRSRLVRCYLGATRKPEDRRPQNFTGFDDNDDLPIDKLRVTPGPLHLINCALNLGGSSDLSLHTRHSASFVITPHAIGSCYRSSGPEGQKTTIGFSDIAAITDDASRTTLGQAISVSGAAASPNQGFHTAPAVAFVLTVFNARLGWWFPNPLHHVSTPSPVFSLFYLTKELFGLANERKKFVMISDGGHFENLGVYELIRRRCRVIIVSDAECDPDYQFEGLGKLIRMCEVDSDLQATIDIDVSAIRPDPETKRSKARCAVGQIRYRGAGPVTTGKLIYIKASMTGHEDTAITQYKDTHPTFPHESTGNQFYGEDQFESYRRLGKETVNRILRSVALVGASALPPQSGPPTTGSSGSVPRRAANPWIALAEKLVATCSPELPNASRFTEHTSRLMDVWNLLGAEKYLKVLDPEHERVLSQKWPDDSSSQTFRSIFYQCSQMIQLMENVYLDLALEDTWGHADNEGWMNLFRTWCQSDAIRKTWALSHQSYGKRFQNFCEQRLNM